MLPGKVGSEAYDKVESGQQGRGNDGNRECDFQRSPRATPQLRQEFLRPDRLLRMINCLLCRLSARLYPAACIFRKL